MNVRDLIQFKRLVGRIPEEELVGMLERDILPHLDEFNATLANSKIKETILCKIFPPEVEEKGIELRDFLGSWGNLSIESIAKICLIIRHFNPRNIMEIGSFHGVTALQMAINSSFDSTVYTLDLPPGYSGHRMSEIDTYVFTKLYDSSQPRRYIGSPWEHKIVQLLGDSTTFDFSPYYGRMDLVLIDGAHDYETKKSDTEQAIKMLTPNGIIIWDNYGDIGCPDVTKYLNELDLPIHHLKNTSLAVYWRQG